MEEAITLETSCWLGQMSRRKTGWPVCVFAKGILVEVVVDAAGECVRNDQRRRHEVVGANLGVDAAFEIAIAAKHGNGDKAVLLDGLRDILGQRAGVADAGGTAVADGVEAELVEPLGQSGLVIVVGDDARARSK